ncbi:MAG: peptide chain release factor N(5)-glutamine methyltransferase [Pseudomonadota bacterium]
MTTRADAIADAIIQLKRAGVPSAERDARLLYRWAAGLTGAGLQAGLTDSPKLDELDRFNQAILERTARQPVSHITGTREFWGRLFKVTPDVLDPRPETEVLVAEALRTHPKRILDLGTGSGCILISLLADLPDASGIGLDISRSALEVAAENATRLGVSPRATFVQGDWSEMPTGPFDLVVSNPPYLSEAEMHDLQPELHHEPRKALSPGNDGLDAYRALVGPSIGALKPGGSLMLEIGSSQADSVQIIIEKSGLRDLRIVRDFDGRDRVVVARKATNS